MLGVQTGRTDIPLTENGEVKAKQMGEQLVGPGSMFISSFDFLDILITLLGIEILDPANLCTVFVSPRLRAHRTFHLLFDHLEKLPDHVMTEEVREWDYGDYEGLKPAEIQAKNPGWFIWRDGCPGGESTAEMCHRVDYVIDKVREVHVIDQHSLMTARSIGS